MPTAGGSPERIAIGQVAGAHGVRGLVRARLYNPESELLAVDSTVTLAAPDGRRTERRIIRAAPHGQGSWLVAFAGVADRTAAEGLAGHQILTETAALPAPAEDEFYHHEVIGFAVETIDGRCIGTITATMPTGLNDVWVVSEGDAEHLIPVIDDVVTRIDRAGRRVVITPIDGLLD